ncbi:hypothetical protein [Dubosiella newyorkensis]|uniref:hypothetical protein n=1 Tax=Dubosiella newyorkensis TaxID=1862672 RepID=UPI003F67DE3B
MAELDPGVRKITDRLDSVATRQPRWERILYWFGCFTALAMIVAFAEAADLTVISLCSRVS